MHGVNLDLLRAAAAHHPDGRPKDAQAHHKAAHRARLRAARRARWQAALARLTRLGRIRRTRLTVARSSA
jgi:hypothetical protein